MSARESDSTGRPLWRQKIRDRAMVLPLLGVVMLLPPVASIFQIDLRVAGVPFTVIYLFVLWAALIAGAALLSRRLRDEDDGVGEVGVSESSGADADATR